MLPGAAVWLPIALLAFVARLLPTLHGGGLGGYDDYDDRVYFAGSQALIAGRLPYQDFVLLHPPGILLVLSPLAALARVVSDPSSVRTRPRRLHGAGIAERGTDRGRRRSIEASGSGGRGGRGNPVRPLAARDRGGVDDDAGTFEHPRAAGCPAPAVPASDKCSPGVPCRGGSRRCYRRHGLGGRASGRRAGVGARPAPAKGGGAGGALCRLRPHFRVPAVLLGRAGCDVPDGRRRPTRTRRGESRGTGPSLRDP